MVQRKKTLNKFILAFLFYLVILAVLLIGCCWLIYTELDTEGKSIGFIIRQRARMKVGGYGGLLLFTPWFLAVVKNLCLIVVDRLSNRTVLLDIDTNYYSANYSPFLTFDVIDVPKKINPNKLLIILSVQWRYVFTNKYYYLSHDIANIKQFEKKGKIHGKLRITATKYSHVIISIEKSPKENSLNDQV